MWLLLTWCVILVIAGSLYFRQLYSSFKKRGLKYKTPIPLVGNLGRVVLGQDHLTDYLCKLYNNFPNERFVGAYEFTTPMVYIRDTDLIKQITIKDFEYFLDHRTVSDEKVDPFWSRNLLSLKGQEWKHMRSTLSPAFTSSKIRLMVPLMVEIGEGMLKYIKEKIDENGNGSAVIKARDFTTRYANDVIASCAFGLKVETLKGDEYFYNMSKDVATFKFRQVFVFFAYSSFPKLMTKLKLSVISQATSEFFRALLSKTLNDREEQNIFRPDMIHLLLEAKKGKLSYDEKEKDSAVGFATAEESAVGKTNTKIEWSQDDLIAQALLFLIGGFETVSSVMAIALHELAQHPDVQDRLYREIKEYDVKNNGKLDFNALQSMVYMDMVVSETLRLWTPAFFMERICTKDYNLGKPNEYAEKDYIIRKGENLAIPVFAIHRDPQYFPDPEKFDPDRFAEENRHNFKSHAYMPFGTGPRNCIGSRFALCELKVILYLILLNFEVCATEKRRVKLNKKIFGVNNVVDDLKFRFRQ